jgi:hypothetical protein
MSLKPALLICAAVLAAGCAIDVPPNDAGCDWVQPIRPSHEDRLTDGTVAQIVALNEVWEEVCGSA